MKTEEGKGIDFPAHYTRAPDGARIRYFDSGESLPPVVLANGLGGPSAVWRPYLERWKGRYRLLTWDYRGLYGSTLPTRGANLGVSAHAGDLRSVLDAAGVSQAALLGWSMGVQVGLEFYSESPNRLTHLAMINGTYGRPLHGVPLPFSGLTLPPLVQGIRKFHRLGRKLIDTIGQQRMSYSVLHRLRLIAPGFTRELYEEMIEEFKVVDLDLYFNLLAHLHEHDAKHHLPHIGIPTLVMAGSRDVLTPPWFARQMSEMIPGAELFIVPDGTHYSAAEYPEIVAKRLESFFPSPSTPGPAGAHLS